MKMRIVILCLTGMFFSLGEGFISVHEGVDKALIASGIVKQLERDILSGDRMRFSAPDVEVQIAGDKTVADKSGDKADGYIEGLGMRINGLVWRMFERWMEICRIPTIRTTKA